jgi:hypothetical protein
MALKKVGFVTKAERKAALKKVLRKEDAVTAQELRNEGFAVLTVAQLIKLIDKWEKE